MDYVRLCVLIKIEKSYIIYCIYIVRETVIHSERERVREGKRFTFLRYYADILCLLNCKFIEQEYNIMCV